MIVIIAIGICIAGTLGWFIAESAIAAQAGILGMLLMIVGCGFYRN